MLFIYVFRSVQLFSTAQNLLSTIEVESSLEYASSIMLMIDYNPSLFYCKASDAWNKIKCVCFVIIFNLLYYILLFIYLFILNRFPYQS